jgi:tRNA(fMet)-specific endonuclease VapC
MADGYVVDTDVISYAFRGDPRAEPFQSFLTGEVLVVSFMTVAELDRWAVQRNWGHARQARMAAFLDRFTILMPDRDLCRTWAQVSDQARRHGRPIQVGDAWIAATAVSLGAPLVTNNRDDVLGVEDLLVLPDNGR